MQRSRAGRLAAAAAVAILALGAEAVRAQTAERYTLAGEAVAIYNFAGALRLERGTGRDVVVLVSRRGADSAQLRVRKERRREGEALRLLFDGRRILYPDLPGRRDSVEVRVRKGRFEAAREGLLTGVTIKIVRAGEGAAAHADLTVLVPPGKRVSVHSAAGEILVHGVDAELRLASVFSPISVERTRGAIRATTHSAPVGVRHARGEVEVETREGGIELADIRAPRLAAHTAAGSVRGEDLVAAALAIETEAGSIDLLLARGERLRLDTGAGAIRGGALEARTMEIEVGAGDVELAGVRAPDLALDVGTGDAKLGLRGDVASLLMEVGGAVRLLLPAELDAELAIEAEDGGIVVAAPARITERTESRLVGRIGAGRGRIEIRADDGVRIGQE